RRHMWKQWWYWRRRDGNGKCGIRNAECRPRASRGNFAFRIPHSAFDRMRYHVSLRDRTYTVDLNGATVSVDGERLEAHWAQIPGTPLIHLILGQESWPVACPPRDGAGRRGAARLVGARGERAVRDQRAAERGA